MSFRGADPSDDTPDAIRAQNALKEKFIFIDQIGPIVGLLRDLGYSHFYRDTPLEYDTTDGTFPDILTDRDVDVMNMIVSFSNFYIEVRSVQRWYESFEAKGRPTNGDLVRRLHRLLKLKEEFDHNRTRLEGKDRPRLVYDPMLFFEQPFELEWCKIFDVLCFAYLVPLSYRQNDFDGSNPEMVFSSNDIYKLIQLGYDTYCDSFEEYEKNGTHKYYPTGDSANNISLICEYDDVGEAYLEAKRQAQISIANLEGCDEGD